MRKVAGASVEKAGGSKGLRSSQASPLLEFNYQPVVGRNTIYHRSGWLSVMDALDGLHNLEVRVKMIDLVDNYYSYPKNPFINCHWIGIMHHVPGVPESDSPSLDSLFGDKRFKRDLFYCLGIYCLSDYLKRYLEQQPLLRGIPIHVIYHPTPLNVPCFVNRKSAGLLFIGNQDRRLDRFLALATSRPKTWLSGKSEGETEEIIDRIATRDRIPRERFANIQIRRVDNEEYDQLLTENIVMVDLFNSSANNTVIECIARSTPILVNRVGGVVEYLGANYPLYFENLQDLTVKVGDQQLIDTAHQYLVEMDKEFLTTEHFLKSLSGNSRIRENVAKINAKFGRQVAKPVVRPTGMVGYAIPQVVKHVSQKKKKSFI